MSLQRAAVNCERCYEIANDIVERYKEVKDSAGLIRRELFNSDKLYTARNEAMKSLLNLRKPTGKIEARESELDKILKALDACESCDFNQPRIKQIIWKKEN